MKKAINEFAVPINGAECDDVTRVAGKGVGSGGAYFSTLGDFVTGHQIEDISNERITQPWRIMDRVRGQYCLVRLACVKEGEDTKLVVDQVGHFEEFHEHISTNPEGFYFRPFVNHFGIVDSLVYVAKFILNYFLNF